MGLYYKSTRNSNLKVTASEAILKGLAPDGGLFVPSELPKLDVSMSDLKGKTYQEIAYLVMKQFLTDFTEEELKSCIDKAYDSKFDTEEIAPLVKVDDTYYMELFHGATIAFKDMALSILPHLMTTSAKKNDVKNEIVILTATSGDTGKAALAGFADVEGTRIIVFYPKNGVSKVQELQMVTQRGENVNVVAIHGNFDNAQSGVKAMFEDKELAEELAKKGYQFSSANSINIGLPIIECPEAAKGIEAGDEVEVDFDNGMIYNRTKGTEFKGQPFPEFMQKLIAAGGLVKYTNSKKAK